MGISREATGRILIASGTMLAVTTLFFVGLNVSDQSVFSVMIVAGATLISSGLAVLFDLFSSGFRSRSCIAGCLFVVASVLVAAAFVSVVFGAYIKGMYFVKGTEGGTGTRSGSGVLTPAVPPHYFIDVARPNAWLFIPLVASAASLFASGLLLLLSRDHM